ncbi:hypothetical protein J7L27_07095 [Candidatus Bathyarchaeota archaeon]|nr:hypothetical protein [Candidatus Bathyarchaeota archaeon]
MLSLERYKPGRWLWAFKHGAYIQERFRYGREFEGSLKLSLTLSEITGARPLYLSSRGCVKNMLLTHH